MGIFKHPKTGIYHANYFDESGKRKRPSLGTKDKRIAELKFADIRRIQQGGYSLTISWKDFKNKFIDTVSPELTKTTINHYKRACYYLELYLNPKLLKDIAPLKLQELKSKLKEEGKGHAGINRWIRALKTMLHRAEEWNYIAPQKWHTVGKLKEVESRIVFYTVEELKDLLQIASRFNKTIIYLGSNAGLRRGEIVNLMWSDIDFKKSTISINPKSNWHPKDFEIRHIPMNSNLSNFLKEIYPTSKSPYVLSKENGKPYSSDEITTLFLRFLKSEKKKGNIHKLRHTFASLIMQNGGNIYELKDLMGHSSIKMTEKYSHLGKIEASRTTDLIPKM